MLFGQVRSRFFRALSKYFSAKVGSVPWKKLARSRNYKIMKGHNYVHGRTGHFSGGAELILPEKYFDSARKKLKRVTSEERK